MSCCSSLASTGTGFVAIEPEKAVGLARQVPEPGGEGAKDPRKVGNYHFKRGNYKGAVSRFREATRWNPSYAEAFLRLGESEEKMHNKQAAQEAYAKYLELAPDGKDAEAVKKKLAGKR